MMGGLFPEFDKVTGFVALLGVDLALKKSKPSKALSGLL
jgi:hypothetical protein